MCARNTRYCCCACTHANCIFMRTHVHSRFALIRRDHLQLCNYSNHFAYDVTAFSNCRPSNNYNTLVRTFRNFCMLINLDIKENMLYLKGDF